MKFPGQSVLEARLQLDGARDLLARLAGDSFRALGEFKMTAESLQARWNLKVEGLALDRKGLAVSFDLVPLAKGDYVSPFESAVLTAARDVLGQAAAVACDGAKAALAKDAAGVRSAQHGIRPLLDFIGASLSHIQGQEFVEARRAQGV